MIIWGWKTVFRVIGSGVFSCPTCGADRNYERRKAQRFFTLFFIPLIPLKVVGEFIRCTYCKNDFRESVLSRPTAAQFTDLLQNTVRGVMVNVLRRGGWDHPAARAVAIQEITNAGALGYAEANLAQDMQVVPADLSQLLASLAGQLPDAGREALVTGAVRVAAADGPLQPAERAVIDTVGAGLGMSQPHVAGLVAAVAPAAGGQPQGPAWGTGQAAAQAPAAGGSAGTAGMETMLIPAPQPPSATGSQPAVPERAPAAGGSGMETMLIQAPQPAPATGSHDAAPPQAQAWGTGARDAAPPQAPADGMETMLIQAPQPAPSTGSQPAVPPQAPAWGTGAQDAALPQPPASAMETMFIPAPQQPPAVPAPPRTLLDPSAARETIPAPPATLVDTSSGMETMAIPLSQVSQPKPAEPAEPAEPADPASAEGPGGWQYHPPQQR